MIVVATVSSVLRMIDIMGRNEENGIYDQKRSTEYTPTRLNVLCTSVLVDGIEARRVGA